jgi:hypothetical protein
MFELVHGVPAQFIANDRASAAATTMLTLPQKPLHLQENCARFGLDNQS